MLPKRRRLSALEVSEVISRGTSVRGTTLSMKYLPSSGPLRAAVVAPKSLIRQANRRNSLRRALYMALETLPPQATFAGTKTVFFVRAIPAPPMVEAMRAELDLLAKKLS